jgi:nuclear pore complex protein Nup188
LQEAAGLGNGQGAAAFLTELGAAGASDAEEIWNKFDNVEAKKRRLVDTYFSERRHFLMVANYALSIKLYDQLPIFTKGDGQLAQLYRLKPSSQAKDDTETLLPAYLSVLSDAMVNFEAGLGSLTDDSLLLVDDVEMDWMTTLLTEAVHACSIILHLADSHHEDYVPSGCVAQWFALMEAYSFFDNIPLVSSD